MIKLFNGDCLEVLKTKPADSVDSLVTDPPAGIHFMSKEWDKSSDFIPVMSNIFKECLRVLKPGAHGLVWAIPRTSHWTATALEQAGFEIRDVVTHIFGSGFPKSLDVSKAIDKMYGAEREVVSPIKTNIGIQGNNYDKKSEQGSVEITIASTFEAKQWEGWGTALKPASEHWILVRKPLGESTIAKNVLKHGTGGLNINGSRIGTELVENGRAGRSNKAGGVMNAGMSPQGFEPKEGRFPANFVLSHNEDCKLVGTKESFGKRPYNGKELEPERKYKETIESWQCTEGCAVKMLDEQSGSNGASRFFYCAKASRKDRNEGLEGMPEKYNDFQRASSGLSQGKNPITGERSGNIIPPQANHHPTVKSTKLMEYLINLITPPNGLILDPFMGSGSTGVAAKRLGFNFVGIEKEKEYFEIAEKRIAS